MSEAEEEDRKNKNIEERERRREELAERLQAGDPALAPALERMQSERWHLWTVLYRVYAGTQADPSLAQKWREDAEAGGLPGRLQQGFLHQALDELPAFEAEDATEEDQG